MWLGNKLVLCSVTEYYSSKWKSCYEPLTTQYTNWWENINLWLFFCGGDGDFHILGERFKKCDNLWMNLSSEELWLLCRKPPCVPFVTLIKYSSGRKDIFVLSFNKNSTCKTLWRHRCAWIMLEAQKLTVTSFYQKKIIKEAPTDRCMVKQVKWTQGKVGS